VDLHAFEGPLDLLLDLARQERIDLTALSMAALADQYLSFVAEAEALELTLAAEFLLMAAWLTHLKSKGLLPDLQEEEAGEEALETAEALAFRLRRLEAMREAGEGLAERARLGRDVFARLHTAHDPEALKLREGPPDVALLDILKAYGRCRRRAEVVQTYAPQRPPILAVEEARDRLRRYLALSDGWQSLQSVAGITDGQVRADEARTHVASFFLAGLEMVRDGQALVRQERAFADVYWRAAANTEADVGRAMGRRSA
jgi:segregation and condensation protein A